MFITALLQSSTDIKKSLVELRALVSSWLKRF
jgi:hypothetical protein